MVSITVSLDDELKSRLNKFSWVNWSELAREEFLDKVRRDEAFKRFDELLKDSKMTDKLALKLADKLKKEIAKKHGL